MTNPTPREALWLSNCYQIRDIGVDGGTDSIDRLTDAGIAALAAADCEIVPKDAAEAKLEACELIALRRRDNFPLGGVAWSVCNNMAIAIRARRKE